MRFGPPELHHASVPSVSHVVSVHPGEASKPSMGAGLDRCSLGCSPGAVVNFRTIKGILIAGTETDPDQKAASEEFPVCSRRMPPRTFWAPVSPNSAAR